jgi:hypothetical protein
MLSDEQIKKFQNIYRKRFGKEIDRKEAYEKGVKLLRLIELIYHPITKEEYRELQRSNQKVNKKTK